MPVQFPQNDQVPGLTFAGYQGLGAGISSGLRDIAAAVEKRREESKRLNAAGKASKSFLKSIAEQTGLDPHEIDSMSAADAIAQMTGLNAAQHYERGAMDAQVALERINAAQAERANAARQPQFFAEAARLAAPTPTEGPVTAAGELPAPVPGRSGLPLVAAAAQSSGYQLPAASMDDVLRLTEGGAGGAPITFSEDPTSGTRFAQSGKSILPSGVNPDKAMATDEVVLPNGEVVKVLKTGKNITTIRERPPKGEVTELEVYRSTTRRLTELLGKKFPNAEDKAEIARLTAKLQAMDKGEVPAAAPPAASASAEELRLAREALKAGRPRARVAEIYKQRTGQDLPP